MVFQMNASGIFQEDHWYIGHIYLVTAYGCQISKAWKDAKVITLPKPGKDPKFPQSLQPISLLSTTCMRFKKVVLKIIQRHNEEGSLLNASQIFPCPSQQDTSMYEAYGPRYIKFQE
jgi:hypothetical protein